AATMLWMAMGLPPAPPMAWVATISSGRSNPMATPVEYWNCENVRLDTVLDPAMKAPRAPIHGAMTGQAEPETSAAPSASVTGMLDRPDSLSAGPDWMSTRTSGTANTRAAAVPASWPAEMLIVCLIWAPFIRCRP